ncbi:MAG: sialate O-acetylesterase, partial [Acidobacteria bacterium]|nr:sialate O-acetylesterase [Acidobacteriota bacterium]
RAQGYAHPIRGALWYQGESDAGRGTDLYLADLRALVSNLRTDLGAPELYFGNCQLATYLTADLETWLPIQEAQRRQALDPLAGAVALIDQPRSDTIHLNVEGYKTAGVRLARVVRAGSYGQPAVQAPKLLEAKFANGARTEIEVRWDKSVAGGQAGLFRSRRRPAGRRSGCCSRVRWRPPPRSPTATAATRPGRGWSARTARGRRWCSTGWRWGRSDREAGAQYSTILSTRSTHPASPGFSLYCSCRVFPLGCAFESPSA